MKTFLEHFYNTERYSVKWKNYFEVYDKHLAQYKYLQPNILEIGIAHGGSTEMLKNYFGLCTVHGVDFDLRSEHIVDDIGVKVTLGDQASEEFWDSYLVDKPDFDIIIDDGGHTMTQQIVTLTKTFPKLKLGGTYIIEDTHTSYWHEWEGGFRKPNSFIEVTKGLVDFLHRNHIHDSQPASQLSEIFNDLNSITYYNSIVILEKKKVTPCEPIDNGKKKYE
jgi:hypothetical protein